MLAPTATRSGTAVGASSKPTALAQLASSGDPTSSLAAIGKALGLGSGANPRPPPLPSLRQIMRRRTRNRARMHFSRLPKTEARPKTTSATPGMRRYPASRSKPVGDPRRSGAEPQLRSARRVESVGHLQCLRHGHRTIPANTARCAVSRQVRLSCFLRTGWRAGCLEPDHLPDASSVNSTDDRVLTLTATPDCATKSTAITNG